YQRQQDVRHAAPAALRAPLRIAMLHPLLSPSMRRAESDADVDRLPLTGRAPWPDAPLRRDPDRLGSYARRIRAQWALTRARAHAAATACSRPAFSTHRSRDRASGGDEGSRT